MYLIHINGYNLTRSSIKAGAEHPIYFRKSNTTKIKEVLINCNDLAKIMILILALMIFHPIMSLWLMPTHTIS